MAEFLERGAWLEWAAHREPRSRARTHRRETADCCRLAAARGQEPLPDGIPALPWRLRAKRAPARVVLRRFAMAGQRKSRPARARGHPLGSAPSPVGGGLSG